MQLHRLATSHAVVLALLVVPATAADAAPNPPELTPTAIRLTEPAVAGLPVYFDAGIQNGGGQDTGVFNIRWFVDEQDVGAYGSHAGLPAHSSVADGNSQFDHTFAAPGVYDVTFVVDADNYVAEGDEGNNSVVVSVDVKPNPPAVVGGS